MASAFDAVIPRISGWKRELRPECSAARRMYVTRAITAERNKKNCECHVDEMRGACKRALTGNVEVGRVDVLSWRGPFGLAVLQPPYATRPRPMPPGKEEDLKLLNDIRIRDVEMVLEHRDGDEPSELHHAQDVKGRLIGTARDTLRTFFCT